MKQKIKKVISYLRTYAGHTVLTVLIILSYIPIIYLDDIDAVKGFSGIALLCFLLYTFLPVSTHQIVLNKFKSFLKKEVKENEKLKYIQDKLHVIEG